MVTETTLVPYQEPIQPALTKHSRKAVESQQTTERLKIIGEIVKTIINNKVVTAVGAYVLIEYLQRTYVTRFRQETHAGQLYAWQETYPVMPDMAGNVLETAIIINLAMSEIAGLISSIKGF
jgi:hypothetical protein